MKGVQRIKITIKNLGKGFQRFPVSMILACAITGLLIVSTSIKTQISQRDLMEGTEKFYNFTDYLGRIAAVLFTGFLLSVNIQLWDENVKLRKGENRFVLPVWIIGAAFLPLLFFILYRNFGIEAKISMGIKEELLWNGLNLILFFSVFMIGKVKKEKNFVGYTMEIIGRISESFIYSAVFFIGLASILFTLDKLFELHIQFDWYWHSAYISFIPLFSGFLLSNYPHPDSFPEEYYVSKAFKVLFLGIITPLLLTYTLILYLYCLKILILREWPKGILGNLTMWYGLISSAVLFFLSSMKTDSFARKVRKFYPIILLPMMGALFVALGIRIGEYGLTMYRYMALVAGVFVVLSMIYYMWRPDSENFTVVLLLILLTTITSIGPFNAYQVEKKSQLHRLKQALVEGEMLENGKIVPNKKLDREKREKMIEIYRYFDLRFSQQEIPYLPDNYEMLAFRDIFGFDNIIIRNDEEGALYAKEFLDYYREPERYDIKGYDESYGITISFFDEFETKEKKWYGYEDKQFYFKFFDKEDEDYCARIEPQIIHEELKKTKKDANQICVIEGSTAKVDYRLYIEEAAVEYASGYEKYESFRLKGIIFYKTK